jgi:adenine-specific DNA-methyltransferase
MPTLHWVGKDKVVNHHHEVPFRVLNKVSSFRAPAGAPANSTDNRIIHGDNLEALKSLLPEFEGRVKCIYIDPPYNTGNEGWVYNDAVNDPKMKRWLGQVVGKEGEDLSRHDKWLCMMYPRLKLLHRLLATDGVFLCSIDDNESPQAAASLDEIFGREQF